MNSKIVAGNWKMNCDRSEAARLAGEILDLLDAQDIPGVDVVLAPPYVHISEIAGLLEGRRGTFTGAQNCSMHQKGAYTGEISAQMLKSAGARYVILGHSERRRDFHENNGQLTQKLERAFEADLRPIFCCGESLDERDGGSHFDAVKTQLEPVAGLPAEFFSKLVIAYEPVWAIGTGRTATPDQAQEMHAFIRKHLSSDKDHAAGIPILYGGSCNDSNAAALFAQPDINGGLIGGASLKAGSFVQIARSFPS